MTGVRRRVLVATAAGLIAILFASPPSVRSAGDDDPVVTVEAIAGSPIKLVRASAEVDAPPTAILAVIDDVERYSSTFPYVAESRVVERTPASVLTYQRLRFPVPLLDDRDYVIRITADSATDGAGRVVQRRLWRLEPTPSVPETPGVVRVGVNEGSWSVVAAPPGKSQVAYCLFTDPGGGIWKWVVNQANVQAVPGLFRALREAVQTARYASASERDLLTAAEARRGIEPASTTSGICAQ